MMDLSNKIAVTVGCTLLACLAATTLSGPAPATSLYAATAAPAVRVASTLGRPVTTLGSANRLPTAAGAMSQPAASFSDRVIRSVATAQQQQTAAAPQSWSVLMMLPLAALFGWAVGSAASRRSGASERDPLFVTEAPSTWAMAATSGRKDTSLDATAVASMGIQGNGLTKSTPAAQTFPSMVMQQQRVRPTYAKEHPVFMEKLNEVFPGAMMEMEFLAKTTKILNQNDLNKDNAITLISVCRDELTRSFVDNVEELWGPSFSNGSLAGMVFSGKTGMNAGMKHAPVCPDGVERYVFFSAPHIAISDKGEIGLCEREGRDGISTACGALVAMQGQLESGSLTMEGDTLDVEMSAMKQQLAGTLKYGQVPSLEDLTKSAQKVIKKQLEDVLDSMDVSNTEYAFISGIQIHGPDGANFFQPVDFYLHKRGGRNVDIDLADVQKADASEMLQQVFYSDIAKVMFVVQQGDLSAVQRWIRDGGNPNSQAVDGKTPLLLASRHGHKEIADLLLDNGADPMIYDKNGRGPLQEAVLGGHDAIANRLRNQGVELPRDVAEFYLWRGAREGNLGVVQRIVYHGPDGLVNCKNAEGDSPLFASVRLNNINVARYLISAGADYTGQDMDGNTIASMAKKRGFIDLEERLAVLVGEAQA